MKKMKNWMKASLLVLLLGAAGTTQAQAQITANCEQKWGPDSVKTIQNISVYREFFKQKNYDSAMEAWMYVFTNAPCSREQTHVDGVAMYKSFIAATKDAKRKQQLVDTLMLIYDVRAANFEKSAGSALGRKGVDMLNFRPEPNTAVLKTFEKAIELGGNESESFVLSYYFKVALKEFSGGGLTKEQIISIYEKLSKIADYNIAAGQNADKFAESKQSLDGDLAGNIIKDCDEIITLFEGKYKADKSNKDLRDLIYSLLLSKGCSDKDLFMEVATAKYNEAPNARLAHILARKLQQSDNVAKAADFYQKAIEGAETDSIKAQYNYDFATLYSSNKQFARARQLAQEAARLQPRWGKPLIFIGDLYAASYSQCGSGIEAQSVYWAAVDKYQRAKSIDSGVTEEANTKINKYSSYFPLKENLFFAGITPGSSYSVGCWIGESTTVRSSD
jgi:tetratricopeptide (TPR) repeat protein